MRVASVSVLVVVMSVLVGCGGSAQNDRFLIEFFGFSEGGLSVVEGDGGNRIVADEGFAGEPLVVIGEEDIASWSSDEWGYAQLVQGEVTWGLAAVAQPGGDLVFRLTVGEHRVWGFIRYSPTGGLGYSPAAAGPGYPIIEFPAGFPDGSFTSFRLISGGVTVDGVDLAQSAWEAWSD
jgi:hypothetical protein